MGSAPIFWPYFGILNKEGRQKLLSRFFPLREEVPPISAMGFWAGCFSAKWGRGVLPNAAKNMNIFLKEYLGFCFELSFELNHFQAQFDEEMNFQNGSHFIEECRKSTIHECCGFLGNVPLSCPVIACCGPDWRWKIHHVLPTNNIL